MRKLRVTFNGKDVDVDIPESWREMSEKQFIAACSLADGKVEEYEFYSQYFGIPADGVDALSLYDFYMLNSLMNFMREPAMLNSFKIARVADFIAPLPALASMDFEQFMMVDTFFNWYVQTENDAYLNRMCAALYLMRGEKVSDLNMSDRAKTWELVNTPVKYAIMVNWSMVRMWVANAYPYLFPSGDSEAPRVKNKNPKLSSTWLDIFDALVEDDLSKIASYKRLHCLDVIRIVNRKIKNQR